MQDVEFFAEVLNRTEKARGIHGEGGEHAQAETAGENTVAAGPVNQCDRGNAEKFDSWIEKCKGEDGIAPRQHVVTVALREFHAGFALAIEYLHHSHAGNVFLQKSIDASDGGADAAVGVAHELAEEVRDHKNERQHGESVERETPVHGK